jgi:putative ABC transport system substrate-binding protein
VSNPKANVKFTVCGYLLLRLVGSCCLLVGLSSSTSAQQAKKLVRIGFLSGASAPTAVKSLEGFTKRLNELGYIEGQNSIIEYRYADGRLNRLPDLAKDLVHLNVDIIVAVGATATSAAKKASELIPIVMTNTSDPVALGLIESLAKPGGNVTGLSNLAPDLGGKQLELLKEVNRKIQRVAVIGDPSSPSYEPQMNEVHAAAKEMSLRLEPVEVQSPSALDTAFASMNRSRVEALIVLLQPSISSLRSQIIERTIKSRIPSIGPQVEFVESGGVLSYGASSIDLNRRAANYVDKVLKGANPANLPVEQPTKFELVINLKTAKQIGLIIPPNVLARADRVIK